MMEIKTQTRPAVPAQEAQPERITGYTASVDGHLVSWSCDGSIHIYKPDWGYGESTHLATAADFLKLAAICSEIAGAMEKENGNG